MSGGYRDEIEPELHEVIQLLPPDYQAARESREEAALCSEQDRNRLHWAADDFITSEKLREEALRLAKDTLGAIRIEDGLEQIREAATKQRAFQVKHFRALCRAIRGELGTKIVREQNAAEQNKWACDAELKRFRAEIEPALSKVLQLVPSNQEGAQQSREEAALCLSGIATDYTWADNSSWPKSFGKRRSG